MNRKDENRFKNQNRERDIVSQIIRLTILNIVRLREFDYSYLSYHI